MSNRIGHLSAYGSIVEDPLPFPARLTGTIAIGRDGSIWFTIANSSDLGRRSTSGEYFVHPIPGKGIPAGLAVGPDGRMWFTASVTGGAGFVGAMSNDGGARWRDVVHGRDLHVGLERRRQNRA